MECWKKLWVTEYKFSLLHMLEPGWSSSSIQSWSHNIRVAPAPAPVPGKMCGSSCLWLWLHTPAWSLTCNIISVFLYQESSAQISKMEESLQFVPFSSAVETGFWHKLTQLKLDVLHLNEEPIEIIGNFCNGTAQGIPALFSVDYMSFNR